MKKVFFSSNGPALSVNIHYESNHAEDLRATYTYTLWESETNTVADTQEGNNFNDDDDIYWLPSPASKNDKRVVDLLSRLKNEGSETIKVRVYIEICQGGERLDKSYEEEEVMKDSSIPNHRFIQLIAQ